MICISSIRIRNPNGDNTFLDVPCGRCFSCLKRKRSEWLLRLEHEHDSSTRSLFLTLTYDEENIPTYNQDYCFDKTHLQKFFKRLRHSCSFRYYAVSEYGGMTNRPHYHLLLFNFDGDIDDIRKHWVYGFIHVGDVTSASINYCAAYVITRNQFDYEKDDPRRPFALYSRRPALGHSYIEKYKKYHRRGLINRGVRSHGKGFTTLPRYYKDKIFSQRQKDLINHSTTEYIEENGGDIISEEDYFLANPKATMKDFYSYKNQLVQNETKRFVNNLKQNRDGKHF